MNLSWTHTHLLLNHFPIVGAIFGLLLLIYALLKDSEDLKKATYWCFVIIALITIPVFWAGQQAEEMVVSLPRVSHALVHAHSNVAQQALIALEILGVMSLFGLFRGIKKTPSWFPISLLVVAIIATGLVSWTGLQGGIIRHTEVRSELQFLVPEDATESEGHHDDAGTEHKHSEQEHHEESGHSHE